MNDTSTRLLLASTTMTLAALGFAGWAPSAEAHCTVNLGTCYGHCEVNVASYCGTYGWCTVNVAASSCEGFCTVNTWDCGYWGSCLANVEGTCDGACTINVLAYCSPTGRCPVNVGGACFSVLS